MGTKLLPIEIVVDVLLKKKLKFFILLPISLTGRKFEVLSVIAKIEFIF